MSEKSMFFHCDNCGVLCRESETYCHNCGTSFVDVVYADDGEYLSDGVSCHDARNYISHNIDRYFDLFKSKPENKLYISKNFAAIFLGPFWFLFRKMYKLYFILYAINLVLCFISGVIVYFSTSSLMNILYTYNFEAQANLAAPYLFKLIFIYWFTFLVVSFVFWAVCGLFGDSLYHKEVYKSIREGYKGGVNAAPAIFIPLGTVSGFSLIFELFFLFII